MKLQCDSILVRSFIIAGIPGFIVGLLILLTVKEPARDGKRREPATNRSMNLEAAQKSIKEKLQDMLLLLRPSLLLLCIASSIRNAGMKISFFLFQTADFIIQLLYTIFFIAGYVWAYNTQVYFDGLGESPSEIGKWMSWIPIVGGSIGSYCLFYGNNSNKQFKP